MLTKWCLGVHLVSHQFFWPMGLYTCFSWPAINYCPFLSSAISVWRMPLYGNLTIEGCVLLLIAYCCLALEFFITDCYTIVKFSGSWWEGWWSNLFYRSCQKGNFRFLYNLLSSNWLKVRGNLMTEWKFFALRWNPKGKFLRISRGTNIFIISHRQING